jgi:hypothetical protein
MRRLYEAQAICQPARNTLLIGKQPVRKSLTETIDDIRRTSNDFGLIHFRQRVDGMGRLEQCTWRFWLHPKSIIFQDWYALYIPPISRTPSKTPSMQ